MSALQARDVDEAVVRALAEDLGVEPDALLQAGPELLERDVTTSALFLGTERFAGVAVARRRCVVCGTVAATRTFELLAEAAGEPAAVRIEALRAEGEEVEAGTAVLRVEGPARVVLAAERTALDFLMVLSGIATEARRWQRAAGEALRVYDTRKTVPGLRALSKHAVAVGGAHNHRAGLWDMVLIKDNHVARAGSVAEAVRRARAARPDLPVEVEVERAHDAVVAVEAGADVVMLDNMDDAAVAAAVAAVRDASACVGRAVEVEVSGGVTIERLEVLASIGVDRVSTSRITLALPVDYGLDES
ncbi:carboxylating nicotinate-nucleotide diphosphorylase [Coriobacteriia bacterium Es71-Z0120]|uniref:carboxylating nicotinate-nucleotide diphosphorylase n=1 Tax=Parvivirga hydrogeniphila TaxID=2939460 RepID=UPI002260E55B|nr:carboxylating nicotinate-nucleotide diphosphorylase [Parvivirga hydrogeniphila]MCL4079402.1 carboxylating nicotinate-nucleotide diphosphorylase [Parvivirga hydrogeniphila]